MFRNPSIAVAATAFLVACASPEPRLYSGIPSVALMGARTGETAAGAARWSYRAAPDVLSARRGIRLEPIEIYRGADRQFDDLSEAEVNRLAGVAATAFHDALAERGLLALDRASDTVRLRVVLAGARPSVPGLSTVTRLTPAGFALNGVKAVGGVEGAFTGSVDYVVEIREDAGDRLLSADVVKSFPSALDVPASIGRLSAAEVGLKRGAEALAGELAGAMGKGASR